MKELHRWLAEPRLTDLQKSFVNRNDNNEVVSTIFYNHAYVGASMNTIFTNVYRIPSIVGKL